MPIPYCALVSWHRNAYLDDFVDGDPVTTWPDSSGNRNDLVALSPGTAPKASALGGPVLNELAFTVGKRSIPPPAKFFNDALRWFFPLDLGTEFAVYLVGSVTAPLLPACGPLVGVNGVASPLLPAVEPLAVVYNDLAGVASLADLFPVAGAFVWSVRRSGPLVTLARSAGPAATFMVPAGTHALARGIGGFSALTGPLHVAVFREIMVFARGLSTAEDAAVLAYLSTML